MIKNTGRQIHAAAETSNRFFVLLLFVAALGFAGHRLRPTVQLLNRAWAEITSYTIGGVMIIAVFPMIFSMILGSSDLSGTTKRRAVFLGSQALIVSCGAVGAGVVLGWLIDPAIDEDETEQEI